MNRATPGIVFWDVNRNSSGGPSSELVACVSDFTRAVF